MASMQGLLIVSMALSLFGASSLRINQGPEDVSFASESSEQTDREVAREVPFTTEDLQQSEARDPGLRPRLEQVLNKVKPVIYFIGDSLLRHQFKAMCLIMGETHKIETDQTVLARGPRQEKVGPAVGDTCTNEKGTMVHSMSISHSPEGVDALLEAGAPPPDVIYWDSATWISHSNHKELFKPGVYDETMNRTIDAYIKTAPDAKLAFFLSHATCHKSGNGKRYKGATREIIKNINDMATSVAASRTDGQGRPIVLVDGYSLSEDKCDMTNDGFHFPSLALDEDDMLLKVFEE